jgi:Na+/H+ antiporter NhaD/arsenite permease-like protein
MSEEEQSQSEKGNTKPKPQQLQIPQAVRSPWLFMLSFAVLGFVVGYFVGQSESPIVATLMPLLFGLIGTGSLFLAQSDKKKRPILETQAIAASVACWLSLVFSVQCTAQVCVSACP